MCSLVVEEGFREEWGSLGVPSVSPSWAQGGGLGWSCPGYPHSGDAAGRDAAFARPAGALVRSRLRSTTRPAVPLPAASREF